jgi:hypothetical protein
MRRCLLPKSAFALWRVGSNSRGDSDPRLRHGTSRGLVITTKLGKPVDSRNFYRAFQTRCRRAGGPTTTVHATRKACASLLIAVDVHPRGGHADTAPEPDHSDDGCKQPSGQRLDFASVEGARRAARRPLSVTTRWRPCCTLLLCSGLSQLIRVAKVPLTR